MFNKNKNDEITDKLDVHITTFYKDNSHNITLIVSNLLAISFLTYFVFFYMKNEVNLLSNTSTHSQAVLGVSEVAETSSANRDDGYEYGINTMEVTRNDKTIQSEVFYSDGISRELDDKSGFKGKVVVVKDDLIHQ
jgi:hypothetical protein